MVEVVLYHHAQGRTPGVVGWADELRRAGHTVHVPDLYEGRTFPDLDSGLAHAQDVGFATIVERGVAAADGLPDRLAYVGLSLGVMPAQMLAQTRPGAAGAVLVGSCVPPSELGAPWPDGLPVQVHGMDADEVFVGEGDLDAARALTSSVAGGELFLYPGDRHLFVDASLPAHDPAATRLLTERTLGFLARLDVADGS
jgi:dienelactone hydrolase